METETLALFEHLSFEFLDKFDVFAPAKTGRRRDDEPPEMMRGFLHCYYKHIYGICPVARELQNTVAWLGCGFDRLPSRDVVDRFLTNLELVVLCRPVSSHLEFREMVLKATVYNLRRSVRYA